MSSQPKTFREEWVYNLAGPDDVPILDLDATYTMRQVNNHPAALAIRTAEGAFVEDFSGRRYLDLYGNNCHHIGYQHPALIAGLIDQLSTLSFSPRGFTNELFARLAQKLSSVWPGNDGRLFLVPGGAAAIELALAVARAHTGRHKSISFNDSFHGRSLGALSLTAVKQARPERLGPLLPGAFHVPSFAPSSVNGKTATSAAEVSLEAIQEVMQREGDIGCVVAEPIRNGGYQPPDWYWPEVRSLCDRYGCLLVFDDIPTGLGKTGRLFNSEHFGVTSDMTVLGKAIGGTALPVAAVIADGRLDTAPELALGYFTHEKNPLMARAALLTLEIIEKERLVERAEKLGPEVLTRLNEIQNSYPEIVKTAQGIGLTLSINVGTDHQDIEEQTRLATAIFYRCIEKGVILNYGGHGPNLKLTFPLNIPPEDIDLAITVLTETIGEYSDGAV